METNKALQKIRKAKGYSQAQIAEILQTTQQQYSKYETATQEIPIRHIITLCELYQVSANYLLGIDVFMTPEEGNKKFNEAFNQIAEMIKWAIYQEHINEESAEILMDNILNIKNALEEE